MFLGYVTEQEIGAGTFREKLKLRQIIKKEGTLPGSEEAKDAGKRVRGQWKMLWKGFGPQSQLQFTLTVHGLFGGKRFPIFLSVIFLYINVNIAIFLLWIHLLAQFVFLPFLLYINSLSQISDIAKNTLTKARANPREGPTRVALFLPLKFHDGITWALQGSGNSNFPFGSVQHS